MGNSGTQRNPLSPSPALVDDKSLIGSNTTKPLLVYLTKASVLASTHEDYRYAIDVNETEYKELRSLPDLNLDQLLQVQGEIKAHCIKFKDVTYPTLIELASDIVHYATKVGGKPAFSYYGALGTQMKILEEARKKKDTELVNSTKEHILKLCNVAIKGASKIADSSASAVAALLEFENLCNSDKTNIEKRQQDIERSLGNIGGEKGGKIKALQDEIAAQGNLWWKNYREFVIATTAAATSVLWLAIPVFGLIIMPIAAGVGSDEARKLHKAMDDCNAVIDKDAALLAQYAKLTFDVNIVKNQTDELHKLIGPAIQVIQDNRGTWKAVADTVIGIKSDIVSKDSLNPADKNDMLDSVMADMNVEFLIGEWNNVAAKADDFRLHAYSTGNIQKADQAELKKQLNNIQTGHGAEPN